MRLFNDLAVPGLGGVWYGKQLLLACLGIAVAEHAGGIAQERRNPRLSNIRITNAVEALACWHAFEGNEWKSDARLRGRERLAGKDRDLSFASVAQPRFYVTQPMRMATVQALPALGFVKEGSRRFNAFSLTESGRAFVQAALRDARPYKRSSLEHLSLWVTGQEDRVHTPALGRVLSPVDPLPEEAIAILQERLLQGGHETTEDTGRRVAALAWFQELRAQRPAPISWKTRPAVISEMHWHDLEAGARLFAARDAAISVLDDLERNMARQADSLCLSLTGKAPPSDVLDISLERLRRAAIAYLDLGHTDAEAKRFCEECRRADPTFVIRALVGRDGNVLRLAGSDVKPGPAFRGSAMMEQDDRQVSDDDGSDAPDASAISLPEKISYRMRNLYLLNLDLHGELDAQMRTVEQEDCHTQAEEVAL